MQTLKQSLTKKLSDREGRCMRIDPLMYQNTCLNDPLKVDTSPLDDPDNDYNDPRATAMIQTSLK